MLLKWKTPTLFFFSNGFKKELENKGWIWKNFEGAVDDFKQNSLSARKIKFIQDPVDIHEYDKIIYLDMTRRPNAEVLKNIFDMLDSYDVLTYMHEICRDTPINADNWKQFIIESMHKDRYLKTYFNRYSNFEKLYEFIKENEGKRIRECNSSMVAYRNTDKVRDLAKKCYDKIIDNDNPQTQFVLSIMLHNLNIKHRLIDMQDPRFYLFWTGWHGKFNLVKEPMPWRK